MLIFGTAATDDGIPDVPQRAVLFLLEHLEIRHRGQQYRVPVHQALAAIDETFFVQAHEYLSDRARQGRVHGEDVARPVDRVAEAAHLARDGAARLLLPLPDAFEEFLAAEV